MSAIPRSSFMVEQWKAFCHETGIKAFGFLYSAANLQERLLWALLICGGFILTILDVADTTRTFISGPTMTFMYVKTEDPFVAPGLTMCINLEDLIEPYRHSWDEESKLAALVSTLDGKVLSNETLNLESLVLEHLALANKVLADIDLYQLYGFPPSNTTAKLYPQLNTVIGPGDRIIDLVSASNWIKVELSVRLTNGDHENHFDRDCHKRTCWFGLSPYKTSTKNDKILLCSSISVRMLNFTDRISYLSVQFKSSVTKPNSPFAVLVGTQNLTSSDSENVMVVAHRTQSTLYVRVAGSYNTLSRSPNLCNSKQEPAANCLLRCIQEKLSTILGCDLQFSYFTTNNTGNLCGLNIILDGNIAATRLEAVAQCKKSCQVPCERTIFSITNSATVPSTNYTRFYVFVETFLYPHFDEVYSITGRQFLGQLGGNLSLWIGASLMVLLHICAFLFKLPSAYLCRKDNSCRTEAAELLKRPENQKLLLQLFEQFIGQQHLDQQ